jgi:hypothetical protein
MAKWPQITTKNKLSRREQENMALAFSGFKNRIP